MRFVTFHVQTGGQGGHPHLRMMHGEYLRLLEMMVRSVRRFHPDALVTVLTDAATDLSPLGVEVHRENHPVDTGALMLSRAQAQWRHLQQHGLDEPVLFLDTDMLVNARLDGLADADFDVALTVRDHAQMPVNGGFLLLNDRRPEMGLQFFERYLQRYVEHHAHESAWFGDQFALYEILQEIQGMQPAAAGDGSRHEQPRLRLLPCDRYNHSPGNRLRKAMRPRGQCRVLHFNGPRKRLMPLYWHAHLAGRPRLLGIAIWAVTEPLRRLRLALARALGTRRLPVIAADSAAR